MRQCWTILSLALLMIPVSGQARLITQALWEPVSLLQASDAPAFPEALPYQVLITPPKRTGYNIQQIRLGLTFRQARAILQQGVPGIKALPAPGLERRWQHRRQLSDSQLRTSYRLIASKTAPDRISELRVNWFSSTLPSAFVHRKLIQQLSEKAGPPMGWDQAQSAYVSTLQRAHKWANARLQQTTRQAQQQPAVRVLLKHQQRQVFQLSQQLTRARNSTQLSAADACQALSPDVNTHCLIRGQALANANNRLISNPGNCHYWRQADGEMMSACAIIGGAQVRITSPAIEQQHRQQKSRREQKIKLKL